MNRILLLFIILLGCISKAAADHITGGDMYYTYIGSANGMNDYYVTVRLFMRCNSGRQFSNPTIISVFERNTDIRYKDYSVKLSRKETLSLTNSDPCITNPPEVCYEVGYYEFHVSVPASSGYIITAHVMFRIDGINNLIDNYDRIGATYVGEIPPVINTEANNSAHFTGNDLVVVCAGNYFSYSFEASDPDGDELIYSFCNAYQTTGNGGFGNMVEPPPPPPYLKVPYGNGFSGTSPLGDKVNIDSETGLITGIAPGVGTYVVTVCVQELRGGTVIATQRKDLQIKIANCSITAAMLPDEYMLCGDSKTLTAKNLSSSPLVSTYIWEFIDRNGTSIFTSTAPEATYNFSDTGLYLIRLFINRDQKCSDSTSAIALVYPGFTPDFNISGPCIIRETQFTDATTSLLGNVNSWEWDFGESTDNNDISSLQYPMYKYSSTGDKIVRLIAQNSLGCRDTISKTVSIFDKPPILLAFRDTLICPPDDLQLMALGSGDFTWSSSGNISDPTIAKPVVNPLATTKYYVEINEGGCVNSDSVLVRVVDHVSLQLMNDLSACTGDTIQLNSITNGLRFSWTPSGTLIDPFSRSPIAVTAATTTYEVTASISSCTATDHVTVTTFPYPVAIAGPDTTICYQTSAFLHGESNGSSFVWAPFNSLHEANTLHPSTVPVSSTSYVLYAFDTLGCSKPGTDTVMVTVQPDIIAFAGRDTTVVINQPLQMEATGGVNYKWSPSNGLSDINIPNPVAIFNSSPAEGYFLYKVLVSNETGCEDSALIQVKIFSTMPEIYAPSAFTPNGDGRNDYFRLVAAGIKNIQTFHVYNRWGELVYNSPRTHSSGWDGTYNGKQLASDTFVWMAKAVDYTGRIIFRKGTVILIR